MTQRQLVRDLMSIGVETCKPDTLIVDITRLLLERGLEGVVIMNTEGHAIGVITQDEIVKAYARDDCRTLTAKEIMCGNIPQIPADIPLRAAAQLMQDQGIRAFYLLHHDGRIARPSAILTYKQLLRHVAVKDDAELSDLGAGAVRQTPLETLIQKREAALSQSHVGDTE